MGQSGIDAWGARTVTTSRPTLAVWKFSSCDGCQLTLLDCEDEILGLSEAIDIAYFLEAGHDRVDQMYDVSLVEGSITTAHDAERIREVRAASRKLVTIGACATSGGVQALRNSADVQEFTSIVYAHPEFIKTLETSTGIADHVPVDLELRGCPISRTQLLEAISALLAGRTPRLPSYSVCQECKQAGNACVLVASGTPCLGPVTQAGCHSLCPSIGRGCFGCFGPSESANTAALTEQLRRVGTNDRDIERSFSTFNVNAPEFRTAALALYPIQSPRRGSE